LSACEITPIDRENNRRPENYITNLIFREQFGRILLDLALIVFDDMLSNQGDDNCTQGYN